LITVGEEAIKGAGRTRLLHWYTLTETTLAIVLLLVLVPPIGLLGVGLSISLTAVVVGVVVTALAAPVVGVSARQTVGAAAPAAVSALVGCAVVTPLEHLVLHSDRHGAWGLATIVLDGLVFLLVYAVLMRITSPATTADVVGLLGGVRRRVLGGRAPSTPASPAADRQRVAALEEPVAGDDGVHPVA
jgi:PST family polysaccharide transporter